MKKVFYYSLYSDLVLVVNLLLSPPLFKSSQTRDISEGESMLYKNIKEDEFGFNDSIFNVFVFLLLSLILVYRIKGLY